MARKTQQTGLEGRGNCLREIIRRDETTAEDFDCSSDGDDDDKRHGAGRGRI
jgi:hypothetical protein